LSLLLGFVEPDEGTLTVGGENMLNIQPADWRRQLSWVPQRPYLISGTISDNIRFGNLEADMSALIRAAELAGLSDFICRLPQQLETPVGSGGFTLSAGERQRIAIARAVLRDAPLVLLDEPTAHLDADREASLSQSLGPWLDSKTVVVAAHRGGLVGRVDRTVTFVGGHLIEVPAGTDRLADIGKPS
jgi:ABC-type bacteriocin/lantibiotic exporter with double-glycine peptidase domain